MKQIRTRYEILEISRDGLIKKPMESGYGCSYHKFYGSYESMEEVDEAILKSGEQHTDYIIVTTKRIADEDI